MKKFLVLLLLPAAIFLQFCGSSKKASSSTSSTPKPAAVAKTTFEADVKPLITGKCGPCHTVGNKKHIGEFAAAKETIDDIIVRIEKNPGERGFMPVRADKLSDSAIAVFKKWKADGLLEK